MPQFITKPEQATPAWITAAMLEFGILPVGSVSTVEQTDVGATTATAVRLHLEYSESAPSDAPKTLFLKFSTQPNEFTFYQLLAYKMPNAPVLKAIAADYNSDVRTGYLLFPDVSDEYEDLEEQGPSPEQVTQSILALADIHSHWWDHPTLHTDIKDASEDILSFAHTVAVEAFPQFVKIVPELLTPDRIAIYDKLLETWPFPALQKRLSSGKNLTIIHGDAHFGNILFSKDTADPSVLLIDWAIWHISTGPTDIAYIGEEDNAQPVKLKTYHDRLLENGIQDYSWDDCLLDYRLASLGHMMWPIFWWTFDLPESIWRDTLKSLLKTYDDLNLGELLE